MLTVEGDQVPVTPFVEVVDSVGAVAPWQNGAIGLKVGTVGAVIVTESVVVVAH